ncbi:MAG: oxidoreductase [Bacteroidetes bacterium]|nr:MAG: oxidoreductase [Bacteroidota bacterium]
MIFISCKNQSSVNDAKTVHLVTLDPGHFHAALVQKTMYKDVDSVVHVYAPAGNDLQLHLDRITAYNNRKENPTHWKEEVYTGSDFFEKMISDEKARLNDAVRQENVIVLSGNNKRKAEYILRSLQNGLNVLADKPMAIDSKGFEQLKQAFDVARKNNLLLYDIMTERFEITSILQRELSMIPEIFGTLQNGKAGDPAVVKESTHYFYKYISGNVVTRPPWFFDVSQQGEGIADVMTHLVDLVQWECFPGQAIDYTKDIRIDSAKHWTTDLSLDEFKTLTKVDSFPSYLSKNISRDTTVKIFSNGEINYTIRGVHAKTTTLWKYRSENNTGDLYSAMMKGTKANLVIRQGAEENYQPTLYVEPTPSYKTIDVTTAFKKIQEKFPGVELQATKNGWRLIIPQKYKEGHEEHFARVTKNFLEYLRKKDIPAWEVPNILAKYYTTTKALELVSQTK